jgi:hypothetical protein
MSIFLGVACSGFTAPLIPKENQTILDSACSSVWIDVEWVPTENETVKALEGIGRFFTDGESLGKLETRQRSEAVKIRNHLADYRVQFAGATEDGKNYIHCNFFPAGRSFSSDWKTEYICVFDSGFWYWNALYDPCGGKTVRFQINGYIQP